MDARDPGASPPTPTHPGSTAASEFVVNVHVFSGFNTRVIQLLVAVFMWGSDNSSVTEYTIIFNFLLLDSDHTSALSG